MPAGPTVRSGRPWMQRARMDDHVAIKPRPHCGHGLLMECPLNTRDWEEVFNAWLAFRFQCVQISERAHDRAIDREAKSA